MKEADRKKQAIRYLRGKMESRELEEDEIGDEQDGKKKNDCLP